MRHQACLITHFTLVVFTQGNPFSAIETSDNCKPMVNKADRDGPPGQSIDCPFLVVSEIPGTHLHPAQSLYEAKFISFKVCVFEIAKAKKMKGQQHWNLATPAISS